MCASKPTHAAAALFSEHFRGAFGILPELHVIIYVERLSGSLHIDVRTDEIEAPAKFFKSLDHLRHLLARVMLRRIFHAVGDYSDAADSQFVIFSDCLKVG